MLARLFGIAPLVLVGPLLISAIGWAQDPVQEKSTPINPGQANPSKGNLPQFKSNKAAQNKAGQNKTAPNQKASTAPAVETLKLKTGEEFRGLVLGASSPQRAWFATQRSWLKHAKPDLAEKTFQDEARRLEAIRGDLAQRIEAWIGQLGPGQEGLKQFLTEEQQRFQEKNPQANSQLVLLPIDPRQVVRHEARSPLVKNLVMLAIQERVEGVETRTVPELIKDLTELGLDPTKDRANILDRLPSMPIDDPADWAARKALFSYQMGKPLILQGSGDVLIEAGKKDAKNGAEALLAQLLPKMLQKMLSELTGDAAGQQAADQWIPKAVAMAEEAKATVVRATRVEPDLATRRIKIEDHLLAKGDNGKWGIVWQMQYSADGTVARAQNEAVIKADPQIAPLLKTAAAFGIDSQINDAIRFGAATMELQGQAEKNFGQFLKVATRRLDGVPLKWLVDK